MNIQQAKEEIARTVRAYTRRLPDGSHVIPVEKQRPLLLIGPPGIGKTAIVQQVAAETGVGLVAYTMTHHTRQSAIGLPFISRRVYGGREVSVTEYTMSEIVASIYDYMEKTGKNGGILFLDEINCVSETLAPVMLQLLQNKTFGNQPLPEDWIIVAAGNPPEYNKSVREMDMATLDRVKNMEIAADLSVWQEYARRREIHPAIRTYLSLYPEHFYNITDTDRGQLFVTARGWEDLSCILTAYEADGETVDAAFFLQYLQHDEIARSFASYYDLFRSCLEGDAPFSDQLSGKSAPLAGCSSAECLAVAALLFRGIRAGAEERDRRMAELDRLTELVRLLPDECGAGDAFALFVRQKREALRIRASHDAISPAEEFREVKVLDELEALASRWRRASSPLSLPAYAEAVLAAERAVQEAESERLLGEIEKAYQILATCPQGRSGILYLTTDLGGDAFTGALLKDHASPVWLRWCRELLN